jgi:iron complex outermembrane recepter protein
MKGAKVGLLEYLPNFALRLGGQQRHSSHFRALLILSGIMFIGNSSAENRHAPEGASDALLEEVVITATKKTEGESLQSVPIAASAFSGTQLEALHFKNLESITASIPNVQLDSFGTPKNAAAFTIRGIGINSSTISVEPAVGTFIDGVYLGVNYGVVLDTFDVESIEVLRGPQGALFGRNVTGGAVTIRTRRPNGDFGVNTQASIDSGLRGTGPMETVASSIEGSIVKDTLFGKLTAYYSHDGGYFYDTFLAKDIGKDTTWFVRPTFVLKTGDNVDNTLIMEHGRTTGDGSVVYNFAGTVNAKPFTSAQNDIGFNDVNYNSATLETNIGVGLGDGRVTNIAGYRDVYQGAARDIDGSSLSIYDVPFQAKQHQLSDELRFAGRFWNRADIVEGLYFFHQDMFLDFEDNLLYLSRHRDYGGRQYQRALGIFVNADVDVTSHLTVSAGARYSSDRKQAQVATGVLTPKPQPCNLQTFTCSSYDFDGTRTFSNTSPRFVLKYRFSPELQAYGSYSRGYRAGGYNLRNTTAAPPGPYADEKADSFELGLKGDVFDHRIRFSAAAFTNTVHDVQRQTIRILPTGTLTILGNAGNERIEGGELDLTAKLIDRLVLHSFAGYTHGKYTKVTADINGDGKINAADQALALPRLVPWSYGMGLAYDMNLATAGTMTLQSDINHRDASYFDDANLGRLPAFNDLSATVAFAPSDVPGLKFSLFGKNLLDEVELDVATSLASLPTGGFHSVQKKGRLLGAEVRYKY